MKPFRVQFSTTRLNAIRDALNRYFTSRDRYAELTRRAAEIFYDLGSIIGFLGLFAALLLLFYVLLQLVERTVVPIHSVETQPFHDTKSPLLKRGSEEGAVKTKTDSMLVQPIIPGVTVPFSDFPIIFFALFISQLVHEAGHFVSATLTSTPLHSVGVSLVYVIPSAFVALASHALNSQPPRVRLRIAAAGAWHNIVFYIIISALALSGLGPICERIAGYSHLPVGRAVIGIDQESILNEHISHGTVVLAFNDQPLSPPSSLFDPWEESLLGSVPPVTQSGWCMLADSYEAHTKACCLTPSKNTKNSSVACFVDINNPGSSGRCVDPVSVMIDGAPVRCLGQSDCRSQSVNHSHLDWACISPHGSASLLRMTLRAPGEAMNKEILWSGSREEIFEEVQVSALSHSWASLFLPETVKRIFEYTKMISLSLAILNLLPLPMLDGSQVLAAGLEVLALCVDVKAGSLVQIHLEEVEAGLSGSLRTRYHDTTASLAASAGWRQWVHRVVVVTTWIGVVCTLGLSLAMSTMG